MNRLTKILFLVAGLLLGTGIVQLQAQSTSNEEAATITITEYSDYQCPACAYYHPMVKKLKQEFGDQVKFNLKYYPLNSHQYAALAARAAQAAKNQGKFIEMHNLLFENQQQWSSSGNPTPIFMGYAQDLGLDMEQFENDLNASETQKTVMEDRNEGRQAGVRATPTFIIEGDMLDNLPRSYAEFKQVVQKYLDKQSQG